VGADQYLENWIFSKEKKLSWGRVTSPTWRGVQTMRLSPVVFVQRDDLKGLHDELIKAWEDQDKSSFDTAMGKLRKEVAVVPRKRYGARHIYNTDGEQPAWVALSDPASEEIECID
jgi:hypothetical protein